MVIGAGLVLLAFVGAPNFANVRALGPGWMVNRAREAPLDGVVFVLEPLLVLGQLALAWALLTNRGGQAVVVVASLIAALLVVAGGLVVLLAAGAAGAGGSH